MDAGPLTTGRKHEGMFISSVEQKHTLQSFGCQKIKLFATFKYVTTQTIRAEQYIHIVIDIFDVRFYRSISYNNNNNSTY